MAEWCEKNIEMMVADYISSNTDGDFTDALKTDRRLGVFFHLSPMRESLLNWYPFDPDASAMELNGGMGALTGLLCERLKRVVTVEPDSFRAEALRKRCVRYENLELINVDIYAGEDQFDYIVAIDPPSLGAGYLGRLFGLLKPHGRMLLACENRFALRYWCGKRSGLTGKPFDTVSGRDTMLGRAELGMNLKAAGFSDLKWYYPITDHWFAQDIFSENYLPTAYSTARVRPYVERDHTLVMNEQLLYKDVIQNGLFDFFSNAFLVEARVCADDAACDVDYVAATTYRSTEKRFLTTIHADKTVRKTPLHPDGIPSLQKLARNHQMLAERGIKTVPLVLKDGCGEMPDVPHETLIDYWQRTLQNGVFNFETLTTTFDRFYDIIKKSSSVYPPGSFGWDTELGEILETAHMELVPANCFYDEKNDDLIFFDQEFARENWPMKHVLFRAIMSINYSTLSNDERLAALFKELKLRYGLAGCWDALCGLETGLIKEIFNSECISAVNILRYVDNMQIKNNVNSLAEATPGSRIRDALLAGKTPRAAIYGFGVRGRRLYNLLNKHGIKIVYLLDQHEISDAPVALYRDIALAPADEVDVIIVSPKADADRIAAGLRNKTACLVTTMEELHNRGIINGYEG